MAVSYDNLWIILKNKGMTQKKLMTDTGISPSTMALIVHNKVVSMHTVISICEYLKCDIGDIVHIKTEGQEAKDSITEYVADLNNPTILKNSIENYIQKNNLTKNEFVKIAGISINTLAKILACEKVTYPVYRKLMLFMSKEIIRNVDLCLD